MCHKPFRIESDILTDETTGEQITAVEALRQWLLVESEAQNRYNTILGRRNDMRTHLADGPRWGFGILCGNSKRIICC